MSPAARVVPAVPTYSVDAGFWYAVPPSHASRVEVGSIVRIPLGGRRVRGYVVEVADRDTEGLREVAGVSGDLPIFHRRLRDALVWAAHHYVAPVSVTLERSGPPNLPSRPQSRPAPGSPSPPPAPGLPLAPVAAAAREGRRHPPTAFLTSWEDMSWLESMAPLVEEDRSVLVVVATAAEAADVAGRARRLVGERSLMITGDLTDAAMTRHWGEMATDAGRLIVGTPRLAAWPVAGLAAAVVLEEGRRAMKDRQTPTVSVHRLLSTRARLEGFAQVYVGPTPSIELLSSGPEVIRGANRAWPLVEVVDRNEEPPGSGLLGERTRAAIAGVLRQGGRVLVFTHRRGYAPAYRCVRCRELRRCPTCGSRPEPGEACSRCGEPTRACPNCGGSSFEPLGAGVGRVLAETRNLYGERAGEVGTGRPIEVGTERDLAAVRPVDLAVAVDVDGLALGSHFRAGEEALRILARLAGRVRRGSGRRLLLQTSMPDEPLVTALRRGNPMEFLHHEMGRRREMGYPPAGELMVIEIRGEASAAGEDLMELAEGSATVMGPARSHDGLRWLVQGESLGGLKLALRPVVQRWRDVGATVRIDVDPIDL
ncbi:MAG: hypothetical protein ACLFWM_12165 [Actinomycetota bacterium]